MQPSNVRNSTMIPSLVRDLDNPNESSEGSPQIHNQPSLSPTSLSETLVFINSTPRSDSPPSSSMSESWIAVTPNSEDGRGNLCQQLPTQMITPTLALAVEGLRIHEHEESFPSEGEEEDEDVSIPPSDDSSIEGEAGESSDEETILAPRTLASLRQPFSDEALRASLSTLLKSKEASAVVEEHSPTQRATAQGLMGMESLALLNPEEFATRTSITSSRTASTKSNSHVGRKSRSKRTPRSSPKLRGNENGAQAYALWTAAITAGFLVGFGAGYAWKDYLTGGNRTEDIRRVGCAWCGEGKR